MFRSSREFRMHCSTLIVPGVGSPCTLLSTAFLFNQNSHPFFCPAEGQMASITQGFYDFRRLTCSVKRKEMLTALSLSHVVKN